MKNLGAIQDPKSLVNKEYVDGQLANYRTAAAQDVIDAGKEAAGLGLTGAAVGDLVRVAAVDANGKPTSWAKVTQDDITNMSVKADELAIVINGNTSVLGAAKGQYVILRNSTIRGKADGLYTAAAGIPANTAIDGTYLTGPIAGGLSDMTKCISYTVTNNGVTGFTINRYTAVKQGKVAYLNFVITLDSTFGTAAKQVMTVPSALYPYVKTEGRVLIRIGTNTLSDVNYAIDTDGSISFALTTAGATNLRINLIYPTKT